MKTIKIICVVISAFIISGCIAQKELPSDLQRELATNVYCIKYDTCEEMWERATFFVTQNSGYKIQIHNDTVIQTFNPTREYDQRLAFSITKEPLGNDKYKIEVSVWCNNPFSCSPGKLETKARAMKYIRTGKK